jgi:hypothetical protein
LILAARITLAHFSVSSAMSLPKSAGELAAARPVLNDKLLAKPLGQPLTDQARCEV